MIFTSPSSIYDIFTETETVSTRPFFLEYLIIIQNLSVKAGASFEGGWGGLSPPKEKEKKKKGRKKKEKRKKKRKKKERKKGTMNNVKLLHIKCCFFPNFQLSGGIEKLKKNLAPPKKKLK